MNTAPSFELIALSPDLTPAAFRAWCRLIIIARQVHPDPQQLQPGDRLAIRAGLQLLADLIGRRRTQVYDQLRELKILQLASIRKTGQDHTIDLVMPSGFPDSNGQAIRLSGFGLADPENRTPQLVPTFNESTTTTEESLKGSVSSSPSGKPDGRIRTAPPDPQLPLLLVDPEEIRPRLQALRAAGVNGPKRTVLATRKQITPEAIARYQADLQSRYGRRYRPGLLIKALEDHQPGDQLPPPITPAPGRRQAPPAGPDAAVTAESLLPASLPAFSRSNAALDGQQIRIPVLPQDRPQVEQLLAATPAPAGWAYAIKEITP